MACSKSEEADVMDPLAANAARMSPRSASGGSEARENASPVVSGALWEGWRTQTNDLVLHGAEAIVIADAESAQSAWVSIALSGRALITNDLLLAHTGRLALSDICQVRGDRGYALSVRPVRFGVLTTAPTVDIRGEGLTAPIRLQLTLRLHLHDRVTQSPAVIRTDFAEIVLDGPDVLTSREFPLHTASIDVAPA
jgi:hypothetical protein